MVWRVVVVVVVVQPRFLELFGQVWRGEGKGGSRKKRQVDNISPGRTMAKKLVHLALKPQEDH